MQSTAYQSSECRLASAAGAYEQERGQAGGAGGLAVKERMQQNRQDEGNGKGDENGRQVRRQRLRQPAILIVPSHEFCRSAALDSKSRSAGGRSQ